MISPTLLEQVNVNVAGEVTGSPAPKKAILEHDMEDITDLEAKIALPWKENLLLQITRVIRDAAAVVGKQRRKSLRAWITSGSGNI